jgi:hypothetical protein
LISEKKEKLNRYKMNMDMLKKNDEIRMKIEEWIKERKMKKRKKEKK